MNKPVSKLSSKELSIVMDGDGEIIHYNFRTRSGNEMNQYESCLFPGQGTERCLELSVFFPGQFIEFLLFFFC